MWLCLSVSSWIFDVPLGPVLVVLQLVVALYVGEWYSPGDLPCLVAPGEELSLQQLIILSCYPPFVHPTWLKAWVQLLQPPSIHVCIRKTYQLCGGTGYVPTIVSPKHTESV